MVIHQRLYHEKARDPNKNLVGVPHFTLLNRGERISVGGVVVHWKKDCFNPP